MPTQVVRFRDEGGYSTFIMENPCFFCGGAAHPATGHAYSERVLACHRCTLEAFRWVKGHCNRVAGKKHTKTALSFYECAVLFPPQPR